MIDLDNIYKLYKERFLNHFVALGDPSLKGTNLPVNKRNVCGTNEIKFSDTTIDMAYHMIFLASDYYLNKNNKSLNMLSDLLDSLERLDSSDIGLYVREDITDKELYTHCSTLLNKESFNSEILIDKPVGGIQWSRDKLDVSTFNRCTQRNIMSQDQFWHLLYGLKMVKTLIKDPAIINKVNKTTDKFLQYSLVKCNQIIKYTNGEKVPRGADMRLFAYGFAKAGENIIEGKKYTQYLHWWNKPLYKIGVLGAELIYQYLNNIFKLSLKEYSYRSLGCISNIWYKNSKYIKTLINDFNTRDWYPHFVLSHKIIYDSDISKLDKNKLEKILLSVPRDGKMHKFNDSIIHYIWSTDSYLYDPEYSKFDPNHEGSYNALDWMVLYNLYKIVYTNGK